MDFQRERNCLFAFEGMESIRWNFSTELFHSRDILVNAFWYGDSFNLNGDTNIYISIIRIDSILRNTTLLIFGLFHFDCIEMPKLN